MSAPRLDEKRAIARAAGVVSGVTVISRITGLARDMAVGYFFGAGIGADAFFVAYRIPSLLRRLVAEGAATAAFIPIFTGYLTTDSRAEAYRVAQVLFTVMALVLAAITIGGIALAGPLTRLFAPGFAAVPGKLELAITLTRIVFPYIFLIGMVAAAMGILNSLREFTAPAMSPVVMNSVMVMAVAVLARPLGVSGVAWAVVVAGIAQLLSQVPALRRLGVPLAPRWEPRHPAVARLGALMLPTVFGSAVYQINVFVSTMFASLLPTGSVSYLWYGERMFEFPLGVFAVALSTAALPSFAALVKRDMAEFRETVMFALRLVNVIALPAAVGLAVVADPITSVLFQRGEFGPAEAQQTSLAVRCFAAGLWSVACLRVVVPAFYALEDTRTPVVTAAVAFVANLAFIVMFIGPVAAPPGAHAAAVLARATQTFSIVDLRHGGLALATSLSATVNLVLLCLCLRRAAGGFDWGSWLASAARTAAATLLMIPVLLWIIGRVQWFGGGVPFLVRASWLLIAVVAGIAVCGAGILALGGPEVRTVRAALMRRWMRMRPA